MMMELALQMFGAAGLVETFVEFTYIWSERQSFSNFEEVFFLVTSLCELVGEAIFLCTAAFWLITTPPRTFQWCYVTMLAKDPIHVLASYSRIGGQSIGAHERQYVTACFVALSIPMLPMFLWATYYPVWRGVFEGQGDDSFRWSLSAASSLLVVAGIILGISNGGCGGIEIPEKWMEAFSFLVPVTYLLPKLFGAHVFLSNIERLSPGMLGMAFISLQIVEILSVASFYNRLCSVSVFTPRDVHTASPLPMTVMAGGEADEAAGGDEAEVRNSTDDRTNLLGSANA